MHDRVRSDVVRRPQYPVGHLNGQLAGVVSRLRRSGRARGLSPRGSFGGRAPFGSRRGFALPLALVVFLVLAIGLTGSLAFATSERRVVDNTTLQEEAFFVAQDGLDQFLSNRSGLGLSGVPVAPETVSISVRGGTANIVLEQVRPEVGGDPALYLIRSTGVIDGPRSWDPPSRRTVAQLAEWQETTMLPNAGWTSLTGLHKGGTSGTISGVDNCGVSPSVAGISVPNPPGFSDSGNFDPEGSPPLQEVPTVQELIDQIGLDWEGIVNQSSLIPDVVLPGGSWPSFSDPDYWPVIHVTGDFSIPTTGRGILVVTGGHLTVDGGKTWSGIVLVGEHLISNGNNTVLGAVFTGLDAMLQADPQAWAETLGQNSVGNGNKIYQYDSCIIESALESFGGLRVLSDTWMDNWPAW